MGNNTYLKEAIDVIAELQDLKTHSDVLRLYSAYIERFGFSSFIMTGLPKSGYETKIVACQMPSEWIERYQAARYYSDDPVVQSCLDLTDPFYWNAAPIKTDRSRLLMGEASDFGLRQGLAIPMHDPDGEMGIVSLAGRRIDFDPAVRQAVQIVSFCAFGLLTRSMENPRWAAEGNIIRIASRRRVPTHALATEREAAHILARIFNGLTVWELGYERAVLSFEADLDLHDRLCVWGSEGEDLEDDTPLEDDAPLEDDEREPDDG